MNRRGFTLVEMCVVLVVIGLLIGTILPPLMAWRKASQESLTQSNLQTLLRASAAYVQANGCLPCPTPVMAAANGFGVVRGDVSASPAPCGSCPAWEGVAPFVSLGLPLAIAKDGWGRWIRMRVDPALTAAFGIVPPFASCSTGTACVSSTSAVNGFCKVGIDATNRINVVTPPSTTQQKAAILFLSHGANGFGAYVRKEVVDGANPSLIGFPAGTSSCASGGREACNANAEGADDANRPSFYNATFVVSDANGFDDLMVYLDRNGLAAFFGNGACASAW
jgi:prepilin-type N-terminal cleavage/methylation domain-containing protein